MKTVGKTAAGDAASLMTGTGLLLKVDDVCLYFRASNGVVRAVDHVSFELYRGRSLTILGESGCGKTSLARAILRLLPRGTYR